MAAARRNVFSPVVVAALLVSAGGLMALEAARRGDRFFPGLNEPAAPLAQSPPVTGPAGPRLAERVVIVIVDGLRLRDSYNLPYLDRLRRAGVDAVATSHYPTLSRPNHTTIVTGVPPRWSGVRNNFFSAVVGIDSLMDRALAGHLRSGFVGDYSPSLAVLFRDDFEDMHYTIWPGGFVKAARLLVGRAYPLVVLIPGSVDEAGHARGASHPSYRAAAQRVDRDLAEALAGLDLARDAVIVTADHGHLDRGGHGGLEDEVVEVPLIMAGAGIRRGAAIASAELADIAPTAAALLGLPPPGHALGHTLVGALQLDEPARAALRAADRRRIAALQAIIDRLQDSARQRDARALVTRSILLALFTLLGMLALSLCRRADALHFDWRVLLIAVPAFPLTYYALLDAFGQHFSLSALPDRDHTLRKLFQFGLVSTVVHVAACWFALRGRVVLRDRLAAANAFTLCGMFGSALPAGLVWAVYAAGYRTDLPDPDLVVLIPATYVAVACFAIASALTLGLEIIIFFARAVDPRQHGNGASGPPAPELPPEPRQPAPGTGAGEGRRDAE